MGPEPRGLKVGSTYVDEDFQHDSENPVVRTAIPSITVGVPQRHR